MPLLRRRRPRRARRLRRLVKLAGLAAGIVAYRNNKLAENERRYGPGALR